ncbi:unnamed protein product [Peniophora sp. CBMAI 1063]|nr:unnamed protein product [Peniophora sp. CBMAI 1063]
MLTSAHIHSLTLPDALFSSPVYSIVCPVVLGAAIGYATRPDKTKAIYRALKQPPLNPPAWLFGPVWTTLYAGMGYASHRAWVAGINSLDPEVVHATKVGAGLYLGQLVLNYAWMPLFFTFYRPVEATADIVALIGAVATLAHTWHQVDETAAWILAPYLAWLAFATYLSAGAGYLNNWDFSRFKGAADRDIKRD